MAWYNTIQSKYLQKIGFSAKHIVSKKQLRYSYKWMSIILFIFLYLPLGLFASKDPEVSERFEGATGGILVGAYKEVQDPVFYTSQQQYIEDITKDKYTNTISLFINEETATFIQSDFTYTVKLRVTYDDLTGQQHTIPDFDLEINYKIGQGQKYDARQYYYFTNARKVKVEIIALNNHGASWDVTKVLRIENRLVATRDYKFLCTNTAAYSNRSATTDELKVNWNYVSDGGATHFDIEWAWIDNDALDKYKSTINSQLQLDARLIFRRNATRVTITKGNINYSIPLLYDGEGKLFYRIRPVQYRENGDVIEGKWNVEDIITENDYYAFTGHEDNQLNWQASTSFAEEGKRKSVIQYFDGTLRNRQTVTKDNSTPDKNTVVAETYYDYQGRAAINILPAPTINTVISYARNFNKFQTTQEYPKDVYDLLGTNQSVCNSNTPPLDNNFGTAKYYSPSNPLATGTQNTFDKYIPDAEGYPYTETRYTPDGTGRIAEQSGVGATHQLGSGHQTKYFYGTPDQKELDALFGTEVGVASHYFKNMVRDANGQYSISYVDMHGRTVATALAGNPPANLSALPSYTAAVQTIEKDLITPQNNLVQGRSVVASTTLIVTSAGQHDFHYHLSPLSAEIIACNPAGQTVCYDCYYNLEIKITDACGNIVAEETRQNFTFGTYDQSCSTQPPAIDVTFSKQLTEGEYNITKTLTVNKNAQDWYRENVFKQKNICTTLQQFIDVNYSILREGSDCDKLTCATCMAAVGTYDQFRTRFLQSQGIVLPATVPYEEEIKASWNQSVANCEVLCNKRETQLDIIKAQMLEDMTPPMGQYARTNIDMNQDGDYVDVVPDPAIYPNEPSYFYENGMGRPYNILRPTAYPAPNTITTTAPYYKSPLYEYDPNAATKNKYTTVNKEVDPRAYDGNGNVLNNPEDFAANFDTTWAKSLLIYHPEYPKFKYAVDNLQLSYAFDTNLDGIETWAAASAAGYFQNNGDKIVDSDPFFLGPGTAYRNTMKSFVRTMHRSGSFWKQAYLGIACLADNSTDCGLSVPNALNPSSTLITTRCDADKNYMWQLFRSLYITIKDSIVNAHMSNLVNSGVYTNLKANKYERRFGTFDDYFNQVSAWQALLAKIKNNYNDHDLGEAEIREQYADNCESYIIYWENELKKCPALTNNQTVLDQITAKLKQICIEGSDEDHPFGSSTVKPSSTYNPRKFEDAIEAILAQNNIPVTALCHPYMLDYPRPYDQQVPLNDEYVVDMRDPCICDKLTAFKADMASMGYPITDNVIAANMRDYLLSKYHITVDALLLDKLIQGCNGTLTPNCTTFDPPLLVPGFLANCKPVKDNCISCQTYKQLKQAFKTRLPAFSNVIYANPQTDDEVQQNEAFERYMNISTGFNKRWQEYLDYETNFCSTSSTVWNCERMDSLVNAYTSSLIANPGNNCQSNFAQLFNQVFTQNLSYTQIYTLYQQQCDVTLNVCQTRVTKDDIFALAKDFYHNYGPNYWQDSNWHTTFTNSFNQRFSVGYDYNSIAAVVNTLCGSDFIICGKQSAVRLWVLDSTYRANNYNSAWQNSNCEQSFTNYFNVQTQDTALWNGIVAKYNTQGIPLKVCSPPISCQTLQQLTETYNNLGNAACPLVPDSSVDHCKECYTAFINQSLNSAYTYEQIGLMFQRGCIGLSTAYSLPSCNNIFSCDTLTQFNTNFLALYADSIGGANCKPFFTQKFNEYYGTSYSFADIASIYLLNCHAAPPICEEVPILTGEQITEVYTNFITAYPYPAGYFGLNCQAAFTNYFNQAFSTNYSYEEITNYYIALADSMPQVCAVENALALQQLKDTYISNYGSLVLPRILTNDLFTKLYNIQFTPATPYTWPEVANIYAIAGITLNIYSADNNATLSCIKLKGLNKVYKEILRLNGGGTEQVLDVEESIGTIPDTEEFTAFFNLYFNLDYTNTQIVAFADTCGIGTGNGEQKGIILDPNDPNAQVTPPLCGTIEPHIITPPPADEPCDDLHTLALHIATEQYNVYVTQQYDDFDKRYLEKCLQAKDLETFTVTAPVAEYHYTLYYYDQAGNLVKTVPPAGVQPNFNATFLANVKTARTNETVLTPTHNLVTQYRYNSLNQVTAQKSPDGGESHFWYDRLGRLVVSQNAKQHNANKYSYTLYDVLGRITEVGEKPNSIEMTQVISQSDQELDNWINNFSTDKTQITRTFYDLPAANLLVASPPLVQKNLRNRVSFTQVFKDELLGGDGPFNHEAATYYSYDIHGNVDQLLQDYRTGLGVNLGNRFKLLEYDYDLISGKVNKVSYQPGMKDAYYHQYTYDAENKLTEVYTSRDNIYWERDAAYKYYRHGPLARTVLGQQQVQGIDYAYTIQGWLKGVNNVTALSGCIGGLVSDLHVYDRNANGTPPTYQATNSITFEPGFVSNTPDNFVASIESSGPPCNTPGGYAFGDMGQDGFAGGNANIGRDAYSFNLNYFNNDYKPISNTTTIATPPALPGITGAPLFNGNISSMAVNIPKLGDAHLYGYQYDQLNRIIAMDAFTGLNTTTNIWQPNAIDNYKERVSYDANGNILTYKRNGTTAGGKPLAMDDLGYEYIANSNKLKRVTDAVPSGNYTEDIDNQTETDNYEYDEIGNLVEDKAENIGSIDWTVYGKISKIKKLGGAIIRYTYDVSGNRITKDVDGKMTYYVRDASGNVMAIYTKDNAVNSGHLTQTEVHQYGSSRLGVLNSNVDVNDGLLAVNETGITTFTRGNKFFELSNHLGNVLVTVGDGKVQHTTDNVLVDYYVANVVSANDYYPFGMLMPERNYAANNNYRYGFNGQEKDKEINENITTALYWEYDSRIGRRWNLDPRPTVDISEYAVFGNNPIVHTDILGDSSKPFDFSGAKIKKAPYRDLGAGRLINFFANSKEIGANIGANIWNSGVDLSEDVTNLVASTEGRKAVLDRYYNSIMNLAIQSPILSARIQSGEITLRQIGEKAMQFLSTPNGIEQAGTFITGLALPGMFEAMWGKLTNSSKQFFRFLFGVKNEVSLAKNIPKGFADAEQFAQAGKELKATLDASGIGYKNVGVRGSAVTNVSSKGGGFRNTAIGNLKASDIDVFIELSQETSLNASKSINGFIHPNKLFNKYPKLLEWSQKWSKILGREITPGGFNPGTFVDKDVINF